MTRSSGSARTGGGGGGGSSDHTVASNTPGSSPYPHHGTPHSGYPQHQQQHQQAQHQQTPQQRVHTLTDAEHPDGQTAESDPLRWDRILISMASLGIAAFFLTSGIVQLVFTQFGAAMCGVGFGSDDPSARVTWLVASCWITGLLRLLFSVCIGRPVFNRRVWPTASRHRAFAEQMAAMSFVPDVRPSSRDMSVLDRAQLVAGIIHPAFYHRTLLVAWQEGLLSTLWIMLHILRLSKLNDHFSNRVIDDILRRDRLLDQLFASTGSNYTSLPLAMLAQALGIANGPDLVITLRNRETLYKLTSHTCELFSATMSIVFYTEDLLLVALLALLLLLLPILSRMVKFFYQH